MFIIMDVREGNFSKKTLFSGERLMENNYHWARIAQVNFSLMPVFRINSFSIMNKKVA